MTRIFGLIPAAGRGTRMGLKAPKQYLRLGDKSMLEHAVDALLSSSSVDAVVVVVAGTDIEHRSIPARERVLYAAVGGVTRAESVFNGLKALNVMLGAVGDDWVLVHDAARPCLATRELSVLIDSLKNEEVGGILATRLTDTLKRDNSVARVGATVPRAGLWRAATPQMFRVGLLRQALADPQMRAAVTDEASAVEALGGSPHLVEGLPTNIKVTQPEDERLAEAILRMQRRIP